MRCTLHGALVGADIMDDPKIALAVKLEGKANASTGCTLRAKHRLDRTRLNDRGILVCFCL